MKVSESNIIRAAKIASISALNKLKTRGFIGEAARAQVMIDKYQKDIIDILNNSPRIAGAPALKVVRQASGFIYKTILTAEIKSRI